MALEGFQENVAGWFSHFLSPLSPPGLRSAAGDHLAAGTPSLGVINPVHCPQVSQDPLQVALELTGPIRLLNLRL